MNFKRIQRIYSMALGIMLVISALCLMGACLYIFLSGDGTFSREAVAGAFRPIAVPVFLALALVIGSIFLRSPGEDPAPQAAACKPAPTKFGKKGLKIARIAIFLVALGCLLYGFLSGGTADVLTKAINICSECIGLG